MIFIESFSYRNQKPSEAADLVIDCRSLRNPYRDKKLRSLDGTDPGVKREVMRTPGFWQFFNRNALRIEKLAKEKQDVFVAVGCFGGKHRAVAISEFLGQYFKDLKVDVNIEHTSPAMR